jgi:hypothetical protein
MKKTIRYKASNTGKKFHKSKAFVRCLKGPVGSGKSVACIQEALRLSREQKPNENGIRLTRGVIIRNTSGQLHNTTLKTFKQWVPEEICRIVSSPSLKADVEFPMPDGTTVKIEILFLALDSEKDTRKLLSLEVSWIFINEAREILYSTVKAARERVGRYPSRADGYTEEQCVKTVCEFTGKEFFSACTRKAILMDTNPPDDTHWWYELDANGYLKGTSEELMEQEKVRTRETFEFFASPPPIIKQPDGSYLPNPDADNVDFLDGGYKYYLDQLAGNSPDHINVMVLGNYGMIKTGKPVYHGYNDQLHCGDVKPTKGIPIALGWDFGLTPTVVIGQMMPSGQVRILNELVGSGSVRAFARDVVKPFLIHHYKGYEVQFSLGDPAGNNRGEGEGTASLNILNEVGLGFASEAAPTNDITKRVDAVNTFLMKLVEGGKPGYMLNKECNWLRKGKNGGYAYRRMNVSGGRYADKPDKNDYSHPADAEQYLCLGFIYGYDSATIVEHYEAPELTGGY